MKDQEKIKQLEAENKALKSLLKEGKEVFKTMNDVLGLEKAAQSSFFAAKIATIIGKVQRNPELFNEVIVFSEKINKLEL